MARSLFRPATLQHALDRLGFVQADPIRAPARAQDLTLRHRVTGYRAGDLERLYTRLDVHEDFFVNYGFVSAAGLGADASARRSHAVVGGARPPRAGAARLRRDARRSAPARGGRALRARHASPTTGAGRRARPRICSTRCTTAACCGWCGATRASACTPRTSTTPGPRDAATRRAPARRARRRRRRQVRAAHGVGAQPPRQAAALRRTAVGDPARPRRAACPHGASRTRSVDGVDWYWPRRRGARGRRAATTPSACWRRSIRWCGIARGSSCSGDGNTASRRTRRCRSASWGTTRSRCCGATTSWAGPTSAPRTARLQPAFGYVAGRPPRERGFRAALDEELQRLAASLVREP